MLETRDIFRINLTKTMQERGISQTDLAEMIGVSSSTASDWCNGKKYPRPGKMQKIADYLHVSMSWLMTGEISQTARYALETATGSDDVNSFIRDFALLDKHGRDVVLSVLRLEAERMRNEK